MSEKANKLFKEIECKELSEFLFVYYLSRIYYGLCQRSLEFAYLQLTKESIRMRIESTFIFNWRLC